MRQPKTTILNVVESVAQSLLVTILGFCILGARPGSAQTRESASPATTIELDRLVVRPCRTFPNCPPPVQQVEPDAGTWKTWLLESGAQLRSLIPAPPANGQSEIGELIQLAYQRDAAALDLIRYWDAGSPAYRWNEIAQNHLIKNAINTPRGVRIMALVNVAIYDAMIAAWDLKYLHRRVRPSDLNPNLSTVLPNPQSPSYPSEHAVAAGAASAVLAFLFPNDAKFFLDQAEAAGRSRLLAGVQYPSDVSAGLAVGRAVGDMVIAHARTDGSDVRFTGTVPTGPCHWKGTNPVEPLTGTWRTWVLSTGSQVRPGPPPACDSAVMTRDLAEVKSHPRPIPATAATFSNTRAAYFWQGPFLKTWHDIFSQKHFEYQLDGNPPRSARAYALASVAVYDATVAGWEAKYAYWSIRPIMLDPAVVTLFATPNHPSYPAAHAFVDSSYAAVLGYLFPGDKDFFEAQSTEGGLSRIWAGIHFRSDVEVGLALGRTVAERAIQRVANDGSQ